MKVKEQEDLLALGLSIIMTLCQQVGNQVEIIKLGGIQSMLSAMRRFPTSTPVHEYCFGLLWLFSQNQTIHDEIVDQARITRPCNEATFLAHLILLCREHTNLSRWRC